MKNKALDNLFTNTEYYELVEQELKFGVFYFNLTFTEINCSPGLYDLLAIKDTAIEINDAVFSQLIVPDDCELFFAERNRLLSERNQKFTLEYNLIDFDENYKRIKMYFNAIHQHNEHQEDDAGTYYKVIVKEITEKYQNQVLLEQKIEILDKSNVNLEEFAYVASHDLQEPIRKIAIYSERLSEKYKEHIDEEGVFYLNRINASCDNMKTLLNDLLEYARIENGSFKFQLIDFNKLLANVKSMLELKIAENQTTLSVANLPKIFGIESQLQQLFTNLILNSLKFRKKDADSFIKIDVIEVNKNDYLELKDTDQEYFGISIEDNGIGFEQEFAEKIFVIFQRLNGKHEFGGTGIGLSICKKIITNHNGFIFAFGDKNVGAKFVLVFPKSQIVR